MYNFPWIREVGNECVFYYNLNNGKHQGNANGHIVIRFFKDAIRFYWRNTDFADFTFPENREIFAIDLFSKKTIGNDILNINAKQISKHKPKKINLDKNSINDFICEFVLEIENNEGIFASSTIVSKVRKKLQESIIYKLIVSKKRYETYIAEKNGLNIDEYNRIASEYVDLLTHPKLTSILPPDKVGKGCLFENPEYELQKVMNYRKIQMYENIRKKIQSFFFQKHAIITAYPTWCRQIVYCLTIASMFVWSAFLICKCFDCEYLPIEPISYKCLLCIVVFILLIFIANASLRNNKNCLYPRIIIALITSWMLIVLSGDFVFSLLENNLTNYITIFFCIISILVLFFDAKAYSPYYYVYPWVKEFWHKTNWSSCNWKILPILSFSIFLSLFMGIIIQLASYKDLLKEDNMLYSVTFSSEFKNIEHHITNTQLLIENLEAYKRELSTFPKDTSIHERKNQIKTIKTQFHKNTCINNRLDSIIKCELKNNRQITNHIDRLLPLLHTHIHNHQDFIFKFSDADSLLNLCCDPTSHCNYRVIYRQFFDENKLQTSIILVKKEFCTKHISFYLFPKLLVFHAFLAVLIAFIVQIIFTGKSVTERL